MSSKRSKTPGLYRDPATQHWLIDKWVLGRRIRGSTRTSSLKEAQLILARQIEDVRRAVQFGERPRQTLLGHRNGHITTHYSAPELAELLAAVEKIAATPDRRPALMMLR